MKIAVLVVTMFVAVGAGAQNCPNGFTASGPCGVAIPGQASQAFQVVAPNSPAPGLSGSAVDLIPVGASHWGAALNYATKVNVQAFTATFTFVPNGWAIAFVLQNNTNAAASGGSGKHSVQARDVRQASIRASRRTTYQPTTYSRWTLALRMCLPPKRIRSVRGQLSTGLYRWAIALQSQRRRRRSVCWPDQDQHGAHPTDLEHRRSERLLTG